MTSLIEGLRARKLVQWAVAYIAGGWLLLELLGFVADNFGWPGRIVRSATVVLGVGLLVVLVLAWYHGEKGRQRVGGVELVLLTALLVVGAVSVRLVGPERPPADAPQTLALAPNVVEAGSVAVLPFDNLSADSANEYFSDGITDDILTQLAKIGDLKVISRTSVMRYKDREGMSLRDIGSELGVAAILEGGVQRAGDRVRINAQLVDARTDRHLWAETYDQELSAASLFAIQSDVALRIAEALRARLAPEVSARIERRPTESLEAYDLYTRGRYLWAKNDVASVREAKRLFERAIEVDSGYAPAYAGLADTYLGMWSFGHMAEHEALLAARAAADQAIELDEELADVHVSRGVLFQSDGRWEDARREYERAIELDPNSSLARQGYGFLLQILGQQDAALAHTRRAVSLDPYSVQSREGLAAALLFAEEFEEAIDEALKVLELEPGRPYTYYTLGFAYALAGHPDESIAAMIEANELGGNAPYARLGLAYLYAMVGRREDALEILAEIKERPIMLREIALVHGALGEPDSAFAYLDRAFETEPASLNTLPADPTAGPLRSDPRWEDLVERLGLQ